jgi:hypothetical protein
VKPRLKKMNWQFLTTKNFFGKEKKWKYTPEWALGQVEQQLIDEIADAENWLKEPGHDPIETKVVRKATDKKIKLYHRLHEAGHLYQLGL